MSALARYLAPTRYARPNPGYRVEWRHGEGGPWSPLDPARPQGVSKAQVPDLLASPLVSLVQGDLARVLDTQGRVVGFSVQTDGGLVALPSLADKRFRVEDEETNGWFKAFGFDWEAAWDGCDTAKYLLRLAEPVGVDRRVLTLVGADCAETALAYVPAGEDRPHRAIETARRWAQGEASGEELAAARHAAWISASDTGGGAARHAAWAAAWAAASPEVDGAIAHAAYGAACAAVGVAVRDAAWDTAMKSMAVLVRRRIPLWVLCLAAAQRVPR